MAKVGEKLMSSRYGAYRKETAGQLMKIQSICLEEVKLKNMFSVFCDFSKTDLCVMRL